MGRRVMSSIRRSHRSRFAFVLKSILGLAALGSLAACGSSSNAQSSDSAAGNSASAMPAPTVSLKASEASVPAGSSVTLQWNSANADNCAGSGGWSGTMPPSGSTMTSSLTDDTSYTLTCTGAGGTAAQTVAVKVAWAPSVTLKAGPTTINSGEAANLAWNSVGATACTASGGWHGSVSTGGMQSHGTLTSTTEYEITCTGPGGHATQTATVTVAGKAPSVSLIATPSSVKSGSSSTLTWSSANVTSCTASGGWSGSKSVSGTQSTGAVSANSTYSLTCSGPGGSATQAATVSVSSSAPTVLISAAPSSVA